MKMSVSNLILAAMFSTAISSSVALASSSSPVRGGSSMHAAATRGYVVAADDGKTDGKSGTKKDKKKDKGSADKGGKKEKAPAPTGGW